MISDDCSFDLMQEGVARWQDANDNCTGRGVDAVTVRLKSPLFGASVPINNAAERPSGLKEICLNAVRRLQRRDRQIDVTQEFARRQSVALRPFDEIGN